MVWVIRLYQRFVSPLFPPSCRFTPSCSQYAVEAIQKHGPLRGTAMAAWRILRCNPFSAGGHDPVK
jgi:putative membrane protein insertion efficiency factor